MIFSSSIFKGWVPNGVRRRGRGRLRSPLRFERTGNASAREGHSCRQLSRTRGASPARFLARIFLLSRAGLERALKLHPLSIDRAHTVAQLFALRLRFGGTLREHTFSRSHSGPETAANLFDYVVVIREAQLGDARGRDFVLVGKPHRLEGETVRPIMVEADALVRGIDGDE